MSNLALIADEVTEVPSLGETGLVTLQNLGPGDVFLDTTEDMDETTGIKLAVDDPPLTLSAKRFYALAKTGDADLRYFDGS